MNTTTKADAASANATARLTARICEVNYESLDRAVIDTVKRLITDGIAVAIAGSVEAPPALVADYVRDLGCAPRASVWGFGFKTSPAFAAYNNAVSMHVLDFEPMSNPPTHAVSPTVPGTLALGEFLQADGKQIVAACAKGFEMQGRLLLAGIRDRGELPFHTPGVVGLMGSAVAASHLLGLDATRLANALGIASSRCSGVSANTGSMVKCTHCGNAAMAGLEAALMAQRGFTSHPAIFEAQEGYVQTFFHKYFDYEAMLAYGQPYRCVDPGMAIKFYPSKYPTHFAITAALELRPHIGNPEDVAKMRILTPDIDDADRPQPRSGLEGKFSFQYTAAAALLDGKVGINTFTDDRRFRKDMVDLLGKISVERNPKQSRDTRNMQVEIEITLKNGAVHRHVCTKPPGTWGIPFDDARHQTKIRDCMSTRFKDPRLGQVLELLNSLENLNAQDVGRLMGMLADPA